MVRSDRSSGATPTRTHFLLLAVLTLFAFGVRWNGVDSMLPHRLVGDERVYLTSLARLRGASEHPIHADWFGYYPELVPALASIVPPPALAGANDAPLDVHLARASRDLVVLRALCVLLSALAVPVTFALARMWLSPAGALWAAAIMAMSLLHVWYSPQARPHAPTATLFGFAVFASCRLVSTRSWIAYAAAGAIAGAAIGLLHTGLLVVGPLALAHVLGRRYCVKRPAWLLVIPLLIAAIALRTFYPFAFDAPVLGAPSSLDAPERSLLREETDVSFARFGGAGVSTFLRTLLEQDPLILAGACVGALGLLLGVERIGDVRADRKKFLELCVALSFVVPYAALFGAFDLTYQRYLIPLLPFIAIATVRGVGGLTSVGGRAGAIGASALVAIAIQGHAAAHLSRVRASDDTEEQAAGWIEEHVDARRARIALMPPIDLPLAREPELLASPVHLSDPLNCPWTSYQSRRELDSGTVRRYALATMPFHETGAMAELAADPAAFVRSLDADYFVLELYSADRRRPLMAKLRDGIRACRTLRARFDPGAARTDGDTPFLWRDMNTEYREAGNWALRTLRVERMGPVIEIYGPDE